jgi:6-pyruvoyltetrahydropterin/6-carboxytetrahydropterin synthase
MAYEITKFIEFDAGHRVPNHKSKCRNPHGHRYTVGVTLEGELVEITGASDEGMLADFSDLKRIMMEQIHDPLDHGFIVWSMDNLMRTALSPGQWWDNSDETESWKVIIFPYIPTAENIARWCFEKVANQINDTFGRYNLRLQQVDVWETPTSVATYKWEEVL